MIVDDPNPPGDSPKQVDMIVDDSNPPAPLNGDVQTSFSEEIVDPVPQNGASNSQEVTTEGDHVTDNISTTHAAAQADSPFTGMSSRKPLTLIAKLSEDTVRASNEKVSVTQHAYDLVRLLQSSNLLVSY